MPKRKQAEQSRKMSDIMKEMSEQLFRDPDGAHTPDALHVALFFANLAWNECVGLGAEREGTKNVWQTIEAENPDLWDELKSRDINAMIDELVEYKKAHFPDDQRRILLCGGTPHTTIHVEWLEPYSFTDKDLMFELRTLREHNDRFAPGRVHLEQSRVQRSGFLAIAVEIRRPTGPGVAKAAEPSGPRLKFHELDLAFLHRRANQKTAPGRQRELRVP
jgi:hypothetical protein